MTLLFECPACEALSDKCYRCSECGRDLADVGVREGQEDV